MRLGAALLLALGMILSALWACGPLLALAVPEVGAGVADCLRFVGAGVFVLCGGIGLAKVRSARSAVPMRTLPAGPEIIEMERWNE